MRTIGIAAHGGDGGAPAGSRARLFVRAAIGWAAILVLAIVNGGLREAVLVPRFGRTAAQVASGLLLMGIVAGVAVIAIRPVTPQAPRRLWFVGALWLVMTLAFEFGFGKSVQAKPWDELLAAYTFAGGNLWPLVLVVILAAPAAVAKRGTPPVRLR